MAIEFKKADVAQRKEQGSSKAKVEGSSPSVSAKDLMSPETQSTNEFFSYDYVLRKHKERLAYNAAYQRDLRTIKRLGLNCTVAEFRRKNAGKVG